MTEFQMALNNIQKEVNFICENMESFVITFCRKNTFDVYDICFDGLNIKWVAVDDSGLHSKNERTIATYLRWKENI